MSKGIQLIARGNGNSVRYIKTGRPVLAIRVPGTVALISIIVRRLVILCISMGIRNVHEAICAETSSDCGDERLVVVSSAIEGILVAAEAGVQTSLLGFLPRSITIEYRMLDRVAIINIDVSDAGAGVLIHPPVVLIIGMGAGVEHAGRQCGQYLMFNPQGPVYSCRGFQVFVIRSANPNEAAGDAALGIERNTGNAWIRVSEWVRVARSNTELRLCRGNAANEGRTVRVGWVAGLLIAISHIEPVVIEANSTAKNRFTISL